ncbi:hypothetical protein psal_cds_64 [Pandoravirus salinus]|uniref:Uncharacterized protein n=1 Tax=Pandoravirus salinus TaxID=1349410 RepID=S4VST4_9VIRU|nr:hypothetical protein psal_cds_64 [Pandoravirus salinus]AGO83464.2 hypothetical protein psal_cds_64 [Pandoravirus salinus]
MRDGPMRAARVRLLSLKQMGPSTTRHAPGPCPVGTRTSAQTRRTIHRATAFDEPPTVPASNGQWRCIRNVQHGFSSFIAKPNKGSVRPRGPAGSNRRGL